MHYYSIHGLLVESDILLDSITPIEKNHINSNIDVQIKLSTISGEEPNYFEPTLLVKKISAQDIWISLPDIAKFRVFNGSLIEIAPYDHSEKQSVLLYLFGSIFATLLYQRGALVLHANAIEIDGKAILFAGDSGSGKSTTAAIFHTKGFKVISDDVISINNKIRIDGGFPQIKLFKDSLTNLNIPDNNLTPIYHQEEKYFYPLVCDSQSKSLDIAAIFIIEKAPKTYPNQLSIENVDGIQRFNLLMKNTYRNELIDGLKIRKEHLNLCSKLSKKVQMAKIIRPTTYFSGYDLVNKIMANL